MKGKIRILQFPGSLSIGGVGSMLMNIYRNIDKELYQFDFCVVRDNESEGPFDKEIEANGSILVKLPRMQKIGVIEYIKQVKCTLRENGPYDAVHVHSILNGFYIIIAAKLVGIKKRIYHAHNTNDLSLTKIPFPSLYKTIARYLIKCFSTDYIACGKEAAKYVYGDKYVKSNKVVIIHNALDLNAFYSFNSDRIKEIRRKLLIQEDVLVIGNAARFVKVKNQKYLIDLVFEISKLQTVVMLLAGDGETKKECEQYARTLGIEDNVKFLGSVSNMPLFYNALDIFILPSLFEGLPVSCIEAQACGIPCLQSDTITTESDMGLGLLYCFNLNNTISSIKEQILQLLDKRIIDNEMIRESLSQKGYSIQKTVGVIRKIYDDV